MRPLTVGAASALAITSAAVRAQSIDSARIVDLTYTLDKQTIYWPTEPPFMHQRERWGKTPQGYFYASAKFAAPEHGGTHMDAPIHFNEHGDTADKVAASSLVGPAAVIDFSARAANDRDAALSVADIKADEAKYGPIPDGAIVVARSGWGAYWPDKKRYMGTDQPGDVAGLHFPGYSPEAVDYLLKNRKVIAIAIDTASIDPGASKDFPVHRAWLGANKPAFENVANAGRLPARGATLICAPMKIGDGTGGPTRIFAIMP
jgi:kynurenine formamidase